MITDVSALQLSISEIFTSSIQLKQVRNGGEASVILKDIKEHALRIVSEIDRMHSGVSSVPPSRAQSQGSVPKKQKQQHESDGAIKSDPTISVSASNPATKKVSSAHHEAHASKSEGAHVEKKVSGTVASYLTDSLFATLPIDSNVKRAIAEELKYDRMSAVQEQAIPAVLEGFDVLVKAKTGTGKTLAFLVPALTHLFKKISTTPRSNSAPLIFCLSPTRELSMQIATEATRLCSFYSVSVVILVGGTNIEGDRRALFKPSKPVAVIVGTPGRVLDHMDNDVKFRNLCSGILVQVLDEADRLLDMGFKKEVDRILHAIAQQKKTAGTPWPTQTLLFSATVDAEIRDIASVSLKPGYKLIDTVGDEDQTHTHVPQFLACAPLEQQLPVMAGILEFQMKTPDYKIIVFFATARQCQLMAALFAAAGVSVLEIHSRLSQSARIRTAEAFRVGTNVVMFSSDVSARGMDYPDVSFVLQVGITDKSQYIHRLGRTARAGKGGSGCLLVAPFEEIPMRRELAPDIVLQDMPPQPLSLARATKFMSVLSAMDSRSELFEIAKSTAIAWLGFHKGHLKRLGWGKTELVQYALVFAHSVGLKAIPPIQKKTLGKMGLQGCPGLTVE